MCKTNVDKIKKTMESVVASLSEDNCADYSKIAEEMEMISRSKNSRFGSDTHWSIRGITVRYL